MGENNVSSKLVEIFISLQKMLFFSEMLVKKQGYIIILEAFLSPAEMNCQSTVYLLE